MGEAYIIGGVLTRWNIFLTDSFWPSVKFPDFHDIWPWIFFGREEYSAKYI